MDSLQDDELWYFLTKDKDYPTRIEMIFETFSNEIIKDEFTTYRYFAKHVNILRLWSDEDENIKKVFLSFKFWFDNRELYHLIGFLIATKAYDVKSIYQDFKHITKSQFKELLYKKIISEIDLVNIEEMDYDNNYYNILKILLLFNISTILNNSNSYIRFAYDKFNKENWSIEHIHAREDKGLMSNEAIKNWLTNALDAVKKMSESREKKQISKEINTLLSLDKIRKDDEAFEVVQNRIFKLFWEPDINTIDNLALLSTKVNSSLSNNIFPIKREILIEKDKTGEFIPICTKNVFLKYYSRNILNMYDWNSADRIDYLNEIKRDVNKFLI